MAPGVRSSLQSGDNTGADGAKRATRRVADYVVGDEFPDLAAGWYP